MQLNEYQAAAETTAKYTVSDYPFVALGEEAGEVLGKLAKFGRKGECSVADAVVYAGHTEGPLREDLIKELGDVLWQVSACCTELGVDLSEVAQGNLDKLQGREARGTVVGTGDDR